MPRADQRRWAEIYLFGLANAGGRKSIRKIAQLVGGGSAVQSLQQFVNQSPWEWQPVRDTLARHLADRMPIRAWLIGRAIIHKRGDHSVGVERRFVRDAGRLVNCQVGLSLQLGVDHAAVPVDWRLLLSRRWTDDLERRRRTHIPEDEPPMCEREHVLGMLDGLAALGVPAAPVVLDAGDMPDPLGLLNDLAERGLGYLAEVRGNEPILAGPHLRAVPATRRITRDAQPRALSPWEVLKEWRNHSRQWPPVDRERGKARVKAASARLVGTEQSLGAPVRLIVEHPVDRSRPSKYWITNLVDRPLPDLFDLIARKNQADVNAARDPYGLHDFEGRSYQGWHHHMTLVSVAHAYALLTGNWSDRGHYLPTDHATS